MFYFTVTLHEFDDTLAYLSNKIFGVSQISNDLALVGCIETNRSLVDFDY